VRLTKIFRQAQQSGIVINAHRVNAGQPPQLTGFADFFWFGCEDTEQTAGLLTDIVARRIPARFGLDPRRDVQVLCPMHRGPAGAGNLNQLLQEALTPSRDGAPERRYGGRVFRIGDKVTQLRNNYDKGAAGVFNGTVGVITAMSPEEHTLTVRTDEDEQVDYGFDELDELAHAYAVTIHRSQGSEYPAVVVPLTTSSWMMLQRNLLYTGITRAKKLVVLAGSRRALAAAVRTRGAGRRHTALARRLHPHPQRLPPAAGRAIDQAVGLRARGAILLNSRGGRMDRHAATRRLHRLAEAAGIQIARAHPHMLRHTYVTTMLDAGADLRDVQIAARHADPRTTMRYDRARNSLDRHPNYILAAYMASGTRPGLRLPRLMPREMPAHCRGARGRCAA
jgi:hypothetical protein